MSAPRQILPGVTYLITRRCAQRQFLLRPSPRVNQIFRYCLAYAARRFDIRLHAYCVLSNHYHLVLTDPKARLPEFMHWLNAYLAKSLNEQLRRWEESPGYGFPTRPDSSGLMTTICCSRKSSQVRAST